MEKIPYFDGHCDTVSWCRKQGRPIRENAGHLDLTRLMQFGKAAQFFAMYYDLAQAPTDGMLAATKRFVALFRKLLSENADVAMQCRTAAEVERTNADGKIAVIFSLEGSEMLDCSHENLDWAQEVGIKAIGLTWNHANNISGSQENETERGLNDFGREFVRKAQQRDILVDVSHCSDRAFWDVMEISAKPVIASHSNSRAVCAHNRNLTDDMFKALIQTGGVAGLNYWLDVVTAEAESTSMDDLVRHVDHFMELGGEKNIGLGSDFDGCTRMGGGIRGVQDVPLLWEALSKRGYSDAVLEDIFYRNFLRILA